MKKSKFFILLLTILPWLTFPLLGKRTIKKFLPGALFMGIYVTFEGMLAEKRKWWWWPVNVKPNVLGELPLIWGPFFVGSFWILKYTYKKFSLYVLVNLLVDSFFTIFMLELFKKVGYGYLVRINKLQLSIIFLIKSFVMYGFQVFYDKVIRGEG
ncbi:hypothetical protein AABM38_11960 [Heyndrickxia sp. MSNUG]|uniref:hypothetical protein n=1 Tax=Heyndrickxia sp. MSNUG TaxID=3136677 RepID=UPI003C2FA68D